MWSAAFSFICFSRSSALFLSDNKEHRCGDNDDDSSANYYRDGTAVIACLIDGLFYRRFLSFGQLLFFTLHDSLFTVFRLIQHFGSFLCQFSTRGTISVIFDFVFYTVYDIKIHGIKIDPPAASRRRRVASFTLSAAMSAGRLPHALSPQISSHPQRCLLSAGLSRTVHRKIWGAGHRLCAACV